MPAISRRTFIAQTAAAVPLSHSALAREPLHASNLGVQLYTVRDVITKDPGATLQAIQDIGYTEIEATYANLDQIWSALQQTKLKPVSVHVDLAIFKEGGSRLDSTFAQLKERNFQYVVVPYIPPNERGGADVFRRLAEMLNKSGERAKANGLTLCYHNHAFEFAPLEGTTGLGMMMHETQKGLVSLEMDIFWVSVAGHDPVQLLKTYSGRVALLHLKDKVRGLATQYNENVPRETFKEVGNGSIDIPAVLSEANRAGVRHYFVEQDQTPGNPIESLRESYKYLTSFFKA